MGLILSSLLDKLSFNSNKKETKILLIGLDGAGKTSILYKMKLNENIHTVPTIGFNLETVQYKNLHFNIWDIGGQDKIRSLWKHYFQGADSLIFVIDSSDQERLNIVKETFHNLKDNEDLRSIPILIFANKQDMATIQVTDIINQLELHTLRNQQWFVQGTCALTGDGLYEGFEWLYKTLKTSKK